LRQWTENLFGYVILPAPVRLELRIAHGCWSGTAAGIRFFPGTTHYGQLIFNHKGSANKTFKPTQQARGLIPRYASFLFEVKLSQCRQSANVLRILILTKSNSLVIILSLVSNKSYNYIVGQKEKKE
jgi:hypothetical protein